MTTTLDIYCRISQDYDGTLRSVESQEEDCREAIEDNPQWSVGKVFRDHAKSAWNPHVVRKEWNDLMARLESGEAGGVMVYDLTRFTRKPQEGERLLALAAKGIVVASLTTTFNLLTADGRKQFRDAMTGAAFESDKISERTSRGKRKKARKGRSNASHRGFARDGYLPNPEGWMPGDPRTMVPADQLARERSAVRKAVDSLLAGGTLNAIAVEWNNNKDLHTVAGNRWSGTLVRLMLTAPSLAGLVEHNGKVVGQMAGDEHALDPATWNRLQAHFAARKRGRPATRYLLSGIMRCGRIGEGGQACGAKLYGRPLSNKSPYPVTGDPALDADRTNRQYWCAYMVREGVGCGTLTIDQRFADASVEAMVVARLSDPRYADRMAQVAAKVGARREELRADLRRIQEDSEAIASKTEQRGFKWVDAAMGPLDARKAEIEAELDGLDDPDAGDESLGLDMTVVWDSATLAQKRALVRRAFPEGITVLPATSRGKAALKASRFHVGTLAKAS